MNAHTAEVLAPTIEAAVEKAKRLAALPEVARVLTVQSFIPENQDKKLEIVQRAAKALQTPLNPSTMRPAPSDAEVVTALRGGAQNLRQAADRVGGDRSRASPARGAWPMT